MGTFLILVYLLVLFKFNHKYDNNEIINNAHYFQIFKMVSVRFHYQQILWNSIYFFIQLVSPPYIVHYSNSANTQNMRQIIA